MPMDRRRYGELINNLNVKAPCPFRVVTLLSVGLSNSGDLYGFAPHGDRRLARKYFNGF